MASNQIKILIVDDDKFFHRLISAAIEDCCTVPYEVIFAENGATAKTIFLEQQPDIVITDLMMPVMNGFELTIYLKTSEPTPFVIVMSGTEEHNLKTADTLGPDLVLGKDVLFDKLPGAFEQFGSYSTS